jgi:hypothetical protein
MDSAIGGRTLVAQADELKAFYRTILNDERMPAILRSVGR